MYIRDFGSNLICNKFCFCAFLKFYYTNIYSKNTILSFENKMNQFACTKYNNYHLYDSALTEFVYFRDRKNNEFIRFINKSVGFMKMWHL